MGHSRRRWNTQSTSALLGRKCFPEATISEAEGKRRLRQVERALPVFGRKETPPLLDIRSTGQTLKKSSSGAELGFPQRKETLLLLTADDAEKSRLSTRVPLTFCQSAPKTQSQGLLLGVELSPERQESHSSIPNPRMRGGARGGVGGRSSVIRSSLRRIATQQPHHQQPHHQQPHPSTTFLLGILTKWTAAQARSPGR